MAAYDTADPFNRQDPASAGMGRRTSPPSLMVRGPAAMFNEALDRATAAPAPAPAPAPSALPRRGGGSERSTYRPDAYQAAVDNIVVGGGAYGDGTSAGQYTTGAGRRGNLPLGVAASPYTAPDGTRTNAFSATGRSVATAQERAGQPMSNVAAAPAYTAPAAPAAGGMSRRSTSGDLAGAERERMQRVGELSAAIDALASGGGGLNMASKRQLYAQLIGERNKLTGQKVDQQTGLETFGVNQDNEGAQFDASLAEASKRSDMEFADRGQERLTRRGEALLKYQADAEQNNIKNLLDYRKQQLDEGRAQRDDTRLDDAQIAARIDSAAEAYQAAGEDPLTARRRARQDAAGDAVQAGRGLNNPEAVAGAQDTLREASAATDNSIGSFIRDRAAGIIQLPTGETLPANLDPNQVQFKGRTGLNRFFGDNQTVEYGGREFALPKEEADRLARLKRRSN